MKLTPHEQKILNIISENPKIISNPALRSKVANRYGLTEKTLRNRIAELKKRGLVNVDMGKVKNNKKPLANFYDGKISLLIAEHAMKSIKSKKLKKILYW